MFSTREKEKSSDRSQKFREDGNRLYPSCRNIKDYQTIYKLYAQSIAYAPTNSQEMALAYANLSAVLLRLRKFAESLQAIECCFTSGYPEQSKFKIYLRKIECLRTLNEPLKAKRAYTETIVWIEKTQPEEERKVKLKQELETCYKKQVEVETKLTEEKSDNIWQDFSIKTFNEEIPTASSAITLKHSESMGRHFVATRDIRPGEILVRDRPYVNVCSESCQYICCWRCCEPFANCIPCDCCNNIIFCSVKCKEEAWKEYHEEECKFLSFFFNANNGELFCDTIMAVRILIRAIKEYGTFEKLKEAVKKMDLPGSDPRTRGFTNGQLLGDKYQGFWSLYSHPVQTPSRSIATNIITVIDQNSTLFGKKLGTRNSTDFNLVHGWILKYLTILRNNSFRITRFDDFIDPGMCIFLVGSLFNHSCASNARCVTTKLRDEVFAILPIKKGEQVCIHYFQGKSYPPDERQIHLKRSFGFTCNCVACKNNWPILEEYPLLNDQRINLKIRALFSKMYFGGSTNVKSQKSIKDFKSQLSQLSKLLEELVAKGAQPCQEIVLLQSELMRLFNKVHSYHCNTKKV